nr:PREDICTED: protocadherin Fat 4-like [Latimeria chalumnae]|eukprot:XP_014353256.1 PREDICTED: protocadherin Fat 4-like [Latimeria chalumnae]
MVRLNLCFIDEITLDFVSKDKDTVQVGITLQDVEDKSAAFVKKVAPSPSDRNTSKNKAKSETPISTSQGSNISKIQKLLKGDNGNISYDYAIWNNPKSVALNREQRSVNLFPVQSSSNVHPSEGTANQSWTTAGKQPVLSKSFYSFEVREDSKPDTYVGSVATTSPEQKDNQFTYSIVEDDGDGIFALNPNNGEFTLTRSLDYESEQYYVLTVKATDKNGHFSLARVYFNVLDMNDNPPVFFLEFYSIIIKEDLPVGASILTLNVTDADEGQNAALNVTIISGDFNQQFTIDGNGVLHLKRPVDREQQSIYHLIVQANDQALPEAVRLTSTAQVTINIADVNDNVPHFILFPDTVFLPENTDINTVVTVIQATDRDIGNNSVLEYSLEPRTGNMFTINATSGELHLTEELDREHANSIYFQVIVTDKGMPPLSSITKMTIIVTDVNDNSPTFTTRVYNITVDENIPLGFDLLTVLATDPDENMNGQVRYSISYDKFLIDSVTGLISVVKNLDRERIPVHIFEVVASDLGTSPRSGTATVKVVLRDINDFIPTFQPASVTVHLLENRSTLPQLLYQVTAHDEDLGSNSQLIYAIDEGNEDGRFSLSFDGQLSVLQSLDREETAEYRLFVTAADSVTSCESERSHSAYRRVKTYLRNAMSEERMTNLTLMHVHYDMNIDVDQFFLQLIKVAEAMLAPFTNPAPDILLVVTDVGLCNRSVEVNGGDNWISIIGHGQQQKRKILPLSAAVIFETERGIPALTGIGTVIITVDDLNDNCPKFDKSFYSVTINEDTPVGSTFIKMNASDPDEGVNGKIRYSIRNSGFQFLIDPLTGEIITNAALDRESQDSFALTVLATDGNDIQPLSSSVTVFVIVGDVNDEPPQFLNDPYVANIPMTVHSGSIVYAVTVQDADSGINAELKFTLSGLDATKFTVDPCRGVIFAAETMIGASDITIAINVADQGVNPKMDSTTVTVRFQNSAEFPQTYVDIKSKIFPEDQPLGTSIATVKAMTNRQGLQGPISYYLAAGNFGDSFQISQQTGEVIIKNPLDFETTNQYQLWVEARDSGSPPFSSYTKININISDVNDNFPVFDQNIFRCEIYENEPPGNVCSVSAMDMDSGLNRILQYSIIKGNVNNAFIINVDTAVIRTTQSLDRETLSLYTIIIEAKDKASVPKMSTATVLITVLDRNDNAPKFSQIFLAQVSENIPVGFKVIQITTIDKDSGANAVSTYSIADQSGNLPFSIDRHSGFLTVTKPLDREETEKYFIKVTANDSGWSVNTIVTIYITDVNDNGPQFLNSSYVLTIPEQKEKNTFILQVSATDADLGLNGQVIYYLKSPSDFFRVEATSGAVFTKQFIPFHFSDMKAYSNIYNLIVVASDCSEKPIFSESKVTVTIVPKNNNPPQFLPFRPVMPIPMNIERGTKLVQLKAVDNDLYNNGIIEYLLTGGNSSSLFEIERDTGWIFINNYLSSSINKLYTLVIAAKDKGIPPLSKKTTISFLVTDENQFAPRFSELLVRFSVPEDLAPGSFIGKVNAEDHDQGINGLVTYLITFGNSERDFAIDNTTGVITLVKNLDFEMQSLYMLQICAKDKGWLSKSTSLNVTIQVQDVNDNSPVFAVSEYFVSVPENSPTGITVLELKATDADSDLNTVINYVIVHGNKEMFAMDQKTGVITTQDSFDFELQQFYQITVKAFEAHNRNHYSLAKVSISISNVNEYYPRFTKTQFNFVVSEMAPIGTTIGRVLATDYDLGSDGIVYYMLFGESKKKGFGINTITGEMFISSNVKKTNSENPIFLNVLAKNAGIIHGFDIDYAVVNVSLVNVNDAPLFQSIIYQTCISEGLAVGSLVTTVTAVDLDLVPEWSQFYYSLQNGNVNNSFSINPRTGGVFVSAPLDRETLSLYNLTIIAVDGAPVPATGSMQLEIVIDDINDNSPILITTEGHVMENQPPGTFILTMNATDSDLPSNKGPFTYRLLGSNFTDSVILSTDGILCTNTILDREQDSDLYLPVLIIDAGAPPMSSTATVHIAVLDQNDNPSQSKSIYIQVNYYGSYFPGGMIGCVKPEDPDILDKFNCSIKSGNRNAFSIPINTCDLIAASQVGDVKFNLTVEGNDNVHDSVINSVYVSYRHFTNSTIDNSVVLYLSTPIFKKFLADKYMKFIKTIDSLLIDTNLKTHVYGMMVWDNETLIFLSMKHSSGYYASSFTTVNFFRVNKNVLESVSEVKIAAVTNDPCIDNSCHHGASCIKNSGISPDIVVLESPSVIFVTHLPFIPFTCSCPVGFTGPFCEVDINECYGSPCSNGGVCVNYAGGFFCSCRGGFSGPFCTSGVNECEKNLCQNGGTCENTYGDYHCICLHGYTGRFCEASIDHCDSSPCLNHGSCTNLSSGYHCKCPFGITGRNCELSSLGFEELSYMEFPPLDPRNNIISLEFATVKKNSLILYNYDNRKGVGGEFVALEIIDGKLQFSYNLGNGIVRLTTEKKVADGQFHTVQASRTGKVGFVIAEYRDSIHHKMKYLIMISKISCPRLDPVCQDGTCLNNGICLDMWSFHLCQCLDGFTGTHCEKNISENTALHLNGEARLDYILKESYKRKQQMRDLLLSTSATNWEIDASNTGIEIKFKTRKINGTLVHFQESTSYTTVKMAQTLQYFRLDQTNSAASTYYPVWLKVEGDIVELNGTSLTAILFTCLSHSHSGRVKEKIISGKIQYISEAGLAGHVEHSIPEIAVSDGDWHILRLENDGFFTKLILDNKYIKSVTDATQRFGDIQVETISLGGIPSSYFGFVQAPGFTGCIGYVKYNGQFLPFSGFNDVVVVEPNNISMQNGCQHSVICTSNPCPVGTSSQLCLSDPCENGGQCIPSPDGKFYCACGSNFTGTFCEFCLSLGNNVSACKNVYSASPLWITGIIIPASVVAFLLLLVVFIKCQAMLCKSESKTFATSQKGTDNKAFDFEEGSSIKQELYEITEKQPNIIKAKKSYYIVDETYIDHKDLGQGNKCYGHHEDKLEFYDIDNVSSIAPSEATLPQTCRPVEKQVDEAETFISVQGNFQTQTLALNKTSSQHSIQILDHHSAHKPPKESHLRHKKHILRTFPSPITPLPFIPEDTVYKCSTEDLKTVYSNIRCNASSSNQEVLPCERQHSEFLPAVHFQPSSMELVKPPLRLSVDGVEKLNASRGPNPNSSVKDKVAYQSIKANKSLSQRTPKVPYTESLSDSESHTSFTSSESEYEGEPAFVNKALQCSQQRTFQEISSSCKGDKKFQLTPHSNFAVNLDEGISSHKHSSLKSGYELQSILNLGPTFENYFEVFKDLAELPFELKTIAGHFDDQNSDQEEIF